MNRLRQILTVFLVGLTFFVMQAFGYNGLQAQANSTVTSPEGIYYKGTPTGSSGNIDNNDNVSNDNKQFEQSRNNLKETAENLREKVNNVTESVSRNVGDAVKTPEGIYYKATPNEDNFSNSHKLSQNNENPLKKVADNVREKLNLDEEVPRSTKEFLKSTEKRVEKTVEPVTGKSEGYYQEPPRVR
ncbi:hypothetical protein [Brasilonema sp. UFV-L1]|uniref:hypothetical protein n=1 Tax=Brasilonema sp. UFV-L1 TaxID=2234130 RepID=UPI00145FCE6F|nr:hypothetical protein [Brasilonema sp. UFV-L1]NMG05506.1 hypothetical protein [Brasilonema sp. UFV-L1]